MMKTIDIEVIGNFTRFYLDRYGNIFINSKDLNSLVSGEKQDENSPEYPVLIYPDYLLSLRIERDKRLAILNSYLEIKDPFFQVGQNSVGQVGLLGQVGQAVYWSNNLWKATGETLLTAENQYKRLYKEENHE